MASVEDRSNEQIPVVTRGERRGETYVFSQHVPTARKRHDCDCCNMPIEPGERYVTYTTRGVEGPGWECWKIHAECYLSDEPLFYGTRPAWRWKGAVLEPLGVRSRSRRRQKTVFGDVIREIDELLRKWK
jgi:hypothetical protein